MNSQTTTTVDAIGQMHFEGNIIPMEWFKHIRFENGKPDIISINILADIIYWYKPNVIDNKYIKKFKTDILQRNYQYYASLFGITKYRVSRALKHLESLGLIRTMTSRAILGPNVQFIEPVPDALKAITYPGETL